MKKTAPERLEGVVAAAKQAPGRGLPPVHLWNPAHCGEIDIVIKRNGLWFHEGTPIGREALRFLTNVGDEVEAGPENAIRVETDPATGEPAPYLYVRHGLEALIARPVFYELVDMAEERETPEGPRLEVKSNGIWFPVGPAKVHQL